MKTTVKALYLLTLHANVVSWISISGSTSDLFMRDALPPTFQKWLNDASAAASGAADVALCAKLQDIVHAVEPYGLDDCARFDGDAACCALHRVLEQPCTWLNASRECHRSYSDASALQSAFIAQGRGVRGRPCTLTAHAITAPPHLSRSCATRAVVARTKAEARSLKLVWLQVPHRQELTYYAEWEPHVSSSRSGSSSASSSSSGSSNGGSGGRWDFTACEGQAEAVALLNRSRHDAGDKCALPGGPSSHEECPIPYCRRKNCTRAVAAKLLKLRCSPPPLTPTALATYALSRAVFIGRAGNGELQRLAAGAKLISQGIPLREIFRNTTRRRSNAHPAAQPCSPWTSTSGVAR